MALNPDSPELQAWIRLNLEPGLKADHLRLLLSVFGMPQDICTASTGSLARYVEPKLAARLSQPPDAEQQARISQTQDWLRGPDCRLLTLADPDYPQALLQLDDPPAVLFAHGRLEVLHRPAIAMVGARSATQGGLENAQAFARFLAERGWCIVSGLASGIDAASHEGALQAGPEGGGTLAVLGTGIDRVFPPANRDLAHRIADQGLLISEFPLGTPGLKFNFPRRNRLVAALAKGVLVVEAARRSGSLITARLAGELGREVFAIPGSIHSPLSHGCHALIRQGAKLVESGQDILEELQQGGLTGTESRSWSGQPSEAAPAAADLASASPSPASPSAATSSPASPPPWRIKPDPGKIRAPDGISEADFKALIRALGYDPVGLDALQARTGWATGDLLHRLTLMELAGLLVQQPDGRYARSGGWPETTPAPAL
ncbi:DNA processing protein OS=Castellaniella defragrans OX=75697 GN=HNR28_001394 PE=3 SV=1 [Castellaniella defragrans]